MQMQVRTYACVHVHMYVNEAHRERRENGKKLNPILEHRLVSSQIGKVMNWMDRLHISADERVVSGRSAVVIA